MSSDPYDLMPPTDPTPDIATLLARAIVEHRASGHVHWPISAVMPEVRAILATPSGKALSDRLARAEAAVPDDPWLYDDGRGYGLTCYSCVQWKDLGHRENCKWLAARPARG
jgi:hypothetical protein